MEVFINDQFPDLVTRSFTYGVSFHCDKDFRSTITDERIIWRYADRLIKQCMGSYLISTSFDSLEKNQSIIESYWAEQRLTMPTQPRRTALFGWISTALR
jgi:hypothetical protein